MTVIVVNYVPRNVGNFWYFLLSFALVENLVLNFFEGVKDIIEN